ncbi:hypothetical protein [Kitasatospora sp. GP30]|uniref:hypothetical protein n=1 Tax=Kitasatospora sp. GP30 TaxID=3035084 RepID=UPI001C598EDC|nr:hypothetical protein [Kitasatospora sp. GP30]
MPSAEKAAAFDPIHHHLTHWLDQMLHLVDVVLEDEGVTTETRQRVVRGILYGSPNPADAEMRAAQRDQLADILEARPPSSVVLRDATEQWLGGEQR